MKTLLKTIIFSLMMAITLGANAQTYDQVSLTIDGKAIQVGTENPALVNVPSGQAYGTIHLSEPETISCTLLNCVPDVQVDTTYGGYDARVSGTMDNSTAMIQLVNSQGQITYTVVLMPEQKPAIGQEPPNPFGLPTIPNIQSETLWVLGGIAVGMGIVVYFGTRRGKNYGKIRPVQ